jgi:hypothetical protein
MEIEEKLGIEQVTKSDILELASWERPRSNTELRGFLDRREASLARIALESNEDISIDV